MFFTDTVFLLVFLPLSFALYWAFRKHVRIQNVILIIAGAVFYASINPKYILLLAACIVITYLSGISAKKPLIIAGIVINFLGLCFFKYAGVFQKNVILPMGMSFYVFQATAYLFDVLKGKEEPERNPWVLALFLCFFPVLTAGPVLRFGQMKQQIKESRSLCFFDLQKAAMIFCYGLFLKLVIADRLAVLVNQIYAAYRNYSGQILLIGAIAYSIQILADFAGYSYMAIALALAFGFQIPENFHQPYFATSISDFWRRWHISLSSWLRDYVYIALGGNRKGRFRKYINILITFAVSGIWHGSGFHYLVWGLLHGICQVAEDILGRRVKVPNGRIMRVIKSGFVFILFTAFLIFFRADSVFMALSYTKRIFTEFRPWELTDGTLFTLGIDRGHMFFLLLFVVIMAVVSFLRERGWNCEYYCRQHRLVKGLGFVLLALCIVCFGNYGMGYDAAKFIYAGF